MGGHWLPGEAGERTDEESGAYPMNKLRSKSEPTRKSPCAALAWEPSPGTKHWCVFNDVEIQCLAAGVVTDRMKQQAQQLASTIDAEATK